MTQFFNKIGIKSITHPHLFDKPHRLAGLSSRFDIEYYRDPKHWEYLSGDVVVNKESPSLFFKPLDANQQGGRGRGRRRRR